MKRCLAIALLSGNAAATACQPNTPGESMRRSSLADSWTLDIDNAGVVLLQGKRSSSDVYERFFLWGDGVRDLGSRVQRLGDVGWTTNLIRMNDVGQIVGVSNREVFPVQDSAVGRLESFVWSIDGFFMAPLDEPEGDVTAMPRDINDRGQVIGELIEGESGPSAVLWEKGNVVMLIDGPTLEGAHYHFRPIVINNRAQVAGVVTPSDGSRTEAVLWDDGVFTLLGTLGGHYSVPTDINDEGLVVGYSTYEGSADTVAYVRPFRWKNGQMRALPVPADVAGGRATSVNTAGQIVGVVYGEPPKYEGMRAVLWMDGRPALIGPGYAVAINDSGLVAGTATRDRGRYAVVWDASTIERSSSPPR